MKGYQFRIWALPAINGLYDYLKSLIEQFFDETNYASVESLEISIHEVLPDGLKWEDVEKMDEPPTPDNMIKIAFSDDHHIMPGQTEQQDLLIFFRSKEQFHLDVDSMTVYEFYDIMSYGIGNGKKRNYEQIAEELIDFIGKQRYIRD
jgi:hypothetical protein